MKNVFYPLLFLIVFNSYSQEEIHNKKPNTLVEFSIIKKDFERLEAQNNQKPDIYLNTATPGYLLLVKSTEHIRKIPSEKHKWLEGVFKAFHFEQKVSDLFENEVLIKTDSGEYWLPIQKSLEKYWEDELNKGDYTLIYIRAYGSTNEKATDKWLFTINSFNSNYYDGLWEEALNSFNDNDSANGFGCVQKLIELDPKDGRNFSMLGFYYYDKGYPSDTKLLKKADSLYTKAIKLSPDYSYVYYQKALVNMQLGEYSKAWDNIEIAKKLGEVNIEENMLAELESKLPYSEYLERKN